MQFGETRHRRDVGETLDSSGSQSTFSRVDDAPHSRDLETLDRRCHIRGGGAVHSYVGETLHRASNHVDDADGQVEYSVSYVDAKPKEDATLREEAKAQ